MDPRFVDLADGPDDVRGVNFAWHKGQVSITVNDLKSPTGWVVWDLRTMGQAYPGRLFKTACAASEAAISLRESAIVGPLLVVAALASAASSAAVILASVVAVPRTVLKNLRGNLGL
jgi:hypothetical protein